MGCSAKATIYYGFFLSNGDEDWTRQLFPDDTEEHENLREQYYDDGIYDIWLEKKSLNPQKLYRKV